MADGARQKNSRNAVRTLEGFFQLVATPTLVTFILAGIWHGAGIQFLIFGLLHGLYLTINHAWRIFTVEGGLLRRMLPTAAGYPLTAGAVLVSWIFFRASSVGDAVTVLRGMLGLHGGIGMKALVLESGPLIGYWAALAYIVAGLALAWFMPNTQQLLGQAPNKNPLSPTVATWLKWSPNFSWLCVSLILLSLSFLVRGRGTTFLYFQF